MNNFQGINTGKINVEDNNLFWIVFYGLVLLVAFVFVIMWNVSTMKSELIGLHKLEACQVEMQKAIPDPNDTLGRGDFLKNNCN